MSLQCASFSTSNKERLASCPLQLPHNGFQNGGAAGVAVYVPPGRYVIRRMLEITQSSVVVRGAGVSCCACYVCCAVLREQWAGSPFGMHGAPMGGPLRPETPLLPARVFPL